MQVRVFSPRRKPITCEVGAEETFSALRARLGKELGVAGERAILLHHGEQVQDDVPASSRLEGPEEVLFFMEVADPPKQRAFNPAARPIGGMPGGRGAGRGMPAGNQGGAASLAASLMQRLQQAQAEPGAPPPPSAAQQQQQQHQRAQQQQNAMVVQELLKQLTEMGFSKVRAMAALRSSSYDLIDALQWLEEHADDPESFFEAAAAGAAPAGGGAAGGSAQAAPAPAPAPAAAAVPPVQQAPSPQVLQLIGIFEPVLRGIALVAAGDNRPRQALDEVRLPAMENDGWQGIHAAVRRIWAGERDVGALQAGLDANTSFLLAKALEMVALGADALRLHADDDTLAGMPKDPEFDSVVQQLRPMLQRMAKFAVERTREAYGQGGMVDEGEETQLSTFIDKMEAAQYQLKTGWEMLCAGVREMGDLIECVLPLANGKPDDKSARLLRTLVRLIAQLEGAQ